MISVSQIIRWFEWFEVYSNSKIDTELNYACKFTTDRDFDENLSNHLLDFVTTSESYL